MMIGDGCVQQDHTQPLAESAMGMARGRGGHAPVGVEDLYDDDASLITHFGSSLLSEPI